jgi:hypothetical protein
MIVNGFNPTGAFARIERAARAALPGKRRCSLHFAQKEHGLRVIFYSQSLNQTALPETAPQALYAEKSV